MNIYLHNLIVTEVGDDYVAVSEELAFSLGDTRVCHTSDIVNDGICESDPNEDFLFGLAFVSGVQPITIEPDAAQVLIDDSAEQECECIRVMYC